MRSASSRVPFLLPLLALSASCGGDPAPAANEPPSAPVSMAVDAAAPSAQVVDRRVIIQRKRPSGSLVVTRDGDGAYHAVYDILQNGRGPHVESTYRVAPDGTLASYEGRGHHEMGGAVEEGFAIAGGHARWKSTEEHGDAMIAGPAFYIPMAEGAETDMLLVAALMKAGGTLPLLPSGTAHLEKVGDITVHANGQDKHLVACAISGMDTEPWRVWVTDDGTWFGDTDEWYSIVPAGWESVIDTLIEKKRSLERERLHAIAGKIAHRPPAAGIAFQHARVLDLEQGKWLDDRTVLVVGDTIRAVGPSKATKVPAGAETVDVGGKALLPGLWDMHAHLSPLDGVLDVAAGVTTVRDVGNNMALLDGLKQSFEDGSIVGPHVFRQGFIEGRGTNAAASEITAETPEEAKAAVAVYAEHGYDGIKIYNSMKTELVPLLAREAHERHMSVTGHIPVHMLAHEAVEAGYDGIEHINQVLLNFFATHETDTRTPLRFTLVGDEAADLDLGSKPVVDFFAELRDHRTVIDPTVGTFEQLYRARPGQIIPGREHLVRRMPIMRQRSELISVLPTEGKEQRYEASFVKMLRAVKAMSDAGVPVVAGTDSMAGMGLERELELFVEGGFTPLDALRADICTAARTMKVETKTGTIAPGMTADLLVVDGDPLAKIEDLEKTVATVRSGTVYDDAELWNAVSIRPATDARLTVVTSSAAR